MMKTKSSFIVLFLSLLGSSSCLYIERLNVPSAIKANASEVILDCEYHVSEWERQNGFVLKWYINSINLVYQWIPPRPPQVLGSLRGHVDPTYRASSDPWMEHRALRILRPNPSLSGTYSCAVATFEAEDVDSAKMLIWSPPTKVELQYWRPTEYFINITCSAYNVSPKPNFRFYLTDTNDVRHAIAIHGRTDEKTFRKTHYTSHSWGLALYAATPRESKISCSIYIPGTTYLETREKIYYPDIPVLSTWAESYPPEEGAVRLPAIANTGNSLNRSNITTLLAIILAGFLIAISKLHRYDVSSIAAAFSINNFFFLVTIIFVTCVKLVKKLTTELKMLLSFTRNSFRCYFFTAKSMDRWNLKFRHATAMWISGQRKEEATS